MSDEETLDLGDVGGEEEAGEPSRRGGGLFSGLLMKLLLWGAIGIGFIILGVTTTFVTLNVINKGRSQTMPSISPQYQAKRDPLEYFDNIESIRGSTADENPAIYSARVSLGYEFTKEINDELIKRGREIQNLILLYISSKKQNELTPSNYAKLQEEIKQQINRLMVNGEIVQVTFREFVVSK